MAADATRASVSPAGGTGFGDLEADAPAGDAATRTAPEQDDAEPRRRARRLALGLMAASSLAVLTVLGLVWLLLSRPAWP
jgi:hypothetical protein